LAFRIALNLARLSPLNHYWVNNVLTKTFSFFICLKGTNFFVFA
jgi:hypothetical protein